MTADWNGPRIEDHALIGDLRTAALIAHDGRINFMCSPTFDSPPIFARLLDPEAGGFFQIAPDSTEFAHQQLYLPGTNVLLTRFMAEDGLVEVTDFMPVRATGPRHNLIRMVRCLRGEARMRLVCDPRFDFGRVSHRTTVSKGDVFFEPEGDLTPLRLHTPAECEARQDGGVQGIFSLRAGEERAFVLEDASAELGSRDYDFCQRAREDTVRFWQRWIGGCRYEGRWRAMVYRSALTLKLMTSQDHGSIIAAPTLGLPEVVGGERNWDYRYSWIRDASLCLKAFLSLGHTEEVEAFVGWLEDRIADSPRDGLKPLYRLDGTKVSTESEVDVRGYQDSRPVRVGNGAGDQLQLDMYGPLFDALHSYCQSGGTLSHRLWEQLVGLANWLSSNWETPDDGIWEFRGPRQHFLLSRVMCWTALDRALRIADARSLPGPRERWREERDRIYADVHARFWNEERGAFVQRLGAADLDASALMMPLMGFCGGADPRWLSTLDAIGEDLSSDVLVWRYRPGVDTDEDRVDPMTSKEGSFTMCSFWLVEGLARAGRLEEARLKFEKLLGHANSLGLYSEELGHRGQQLGNFPQALTHIGLIDAALALDRRLSEPDY